MCVHTYAHADISAILVQGQFVKKKAMRAMWTRDLPSPTRYAPKYARPDLRDRICPERKKQFETTRYSEGEKGSVFNLGKSVKEAVFRLSNFVAVSVQTGQRVHWFERLQSGLVTLDLWLSKIDVHPT